MDGAVMLERYPIPIFHTLGDIAVGQNPKVRRTPKTFKGWWQEPAWWKLRGTLLGFVVSFMGSGKSLLLCGLAWDYASGHNPLSPWKDGKPVGRAIIIVPQKMIGWSFLYDACELPDGSWMEWAAANYFCDPHKVEDSTVQAVLKFVRNKNGSSAILEERLLVCSQQAWVLAHEILMGEWIEGEPSPYAGIALIVDEAHRIKNEDLPEGVELDPKDEREKKELLKFKNCLGRAIDHYIQFQPGPLWLATATPMRGDYRCIIPEKHQDKFDAGTYENPAAEYLSTLQHLKRISTRFIVGEIEECVAKLLDGVVANKGGGPTFWYQPSTSNKLLVQDKLELVQKWGAEAKRRGLDVLDLVTEDGRAKKQRNLRRKIRNREKLPDIIFFQDLGREGFDCPPGWRVVVIGARKSFPLVVQIFGRPLRDFLGKELAEFTQVLPFEGDKEIDEAEQIDAYLKAIWALLAIEWHISPLYQHKSPRLRDLDIVDLIEGVTGGFISSPEGGGDVPGVLGPALVDLGLDDPEKELVWTLFSNATKAAIAGATDIPYDVKLKLEANPLGFIRVYLSVVIGVGYGPNSLKEYRLAYLGSRALDLDLLRKNVRLFVRQNGRKPERTDGRLLDYPKNPDLTWDAVADAVTKGSRGLPKFASYSAFISAMQGVVWADEFLGDVEFHKSGALLYTKNPTYSSMSKYLQANRKEQSYVNGYDAMCNCLELLGESTIKHPNVTPEMATALGSKELYKLAKKNLHKVAAFRKTLLQLLERGPIPPREAAAMFRAALA